METIINKQQNMPPPVQFRPTPKDVYILGVQDGWKVREKTSNIVNGAMVLGGAAVGAAFPKNMLNSMNKLITGNSKPLMDKSNKVLAKTRGKAALIGVGVAVGVAAITKLAISTIKSVLPKNNDNRPYIV